MTIYEDIPISENSSLELNNCRQVAADGSCTIESSIKSEDSAVIINLADEETTEKGNESSEAGVESSISDRNTFSNFKCILAKTVSITQTYQCSHLKRRIKWTGMTFLLLLYCIFFIAVLLTPSRKEKQNYWCDSDGLLIIINLVAVTGIFYFKVFKVFLIKHIAIAVEPSLKKIRQVTEKRCIQVGIYGTVIAALLFILILDSTEDRSRLISAFGVLVLLGLGTLFSAYPAQINYRQVLCGIFLQIFFGFLILRWPVGRSVFECSGDKVSTFLNFTYVGSTFAFGKIVTDMNSYVFSFLTMIFFYGLFVSIFFYYGIQQWVIINLGWLLEVTMGTTPCESMSAAANIFLGMSEAPLVIKPYLHLLTRSELHAVVTGGYATIAGTVLAAYISFGVAPSHLITASVMSAPAALAMAKLFYPETEKSVTKSSNIKIFKGEEKNVLHAIMNGLWSAIPLIANITASLIAFVALTAFANSVFDWGCQLLDYEAGTCEIQGFLAYLLMPIAWIMGVPLDDCYKVGYLLGTKFFLTEFVAYRDLMDMFKNGVISARSVVICTYALCGFSSIASMGCVLGALGSMAPSRAKDISGVVFRGLIAGNFACYLTACIAGTLIQDSSSRALSFNSTEVM